MSTPGIVDIYASCKDRREEPDYSLSEDVSKEIGSDFRVIPTFAKGQHDYVLKRHYSLNRNGLLKCRWEEYKKNIEGRVFAPFQFPDVRNLHFYNCAIRYLPSESINQRTDHKIKLRQGPGVDLYGQIPIPHELLMKRTKFKRSLKFRCYF